MKSVSDYKIVLSFISAVSLILLEDKTMGEIKRCMDYISMHPFGYDLTIMTLSALHHFLKEDTHSTDSY
jgi:hypothetical protein